MRRELENKVNAGSMADIAFLLLLFFLVATTIESESGISVKLPPFSIDPPIQMSEDKIITVKVNGENRFLVEGEEVQLENMTSLLKEKIIERLKTNDQPILAIRVDRKTIYAAYINAYNEIKIAYRILREEKAIDLYGKSYSNLIDVEVKNINNLIPMIISESEPFRI